jgi:alpha-tubulin suppressor-like RCC1 family protein
VKCWGDNSSGQLGSGSTASSSNVPVAVSGLSSGVDTVAAGDAHTCAVTKAGAVKCWGDNSYGQLGDGSATNSNITVSATGVPLVSQVAVGSNFTCVLTMAGGVKCFGYNGNGQLGDGTSTSRKTPADVTGLTAGVTGLSANQYGACAVLASGGVKCWGYNGYGQLGNGSTSSSYTPVDVTGITTAGSVAMGGMHACAVLRTGEVKCWGYGGYGQLGNGSSSSSYTPVSVSGSTCGPAYTSIALGYGHTCALMSSGGVSCWGYGGYGQLGNGSTSYQYSPQPVVGL